jgi:hypothetical protein
MSAAGAHAQARWFIVRLAAIAIPDLAIYNHEALPIPEEAITPSIVRPDTRPPKVESARADSGIRRAAGIQGGKGSAGIPRRGPRAVHGTVRSDQIVRISSPHRLAMRSVCPAAVTL